MAFNPRLTYSPQGNTGGNFNEAVDKYGLNNPLPGTPGTVDLDEIKKAHFELALAAAKGNQGTGPTANNGTSITVKTDTQLARGAIDQLNVANQKTISRRQSSISVAGRSYSGRRL